MRKNFAIASFLVVAIAGMTQADIVIKPISATDVARPLGTEFGSGYPVRAINGNGVSNPATLETGDAVPASWSGTDQYAQDYMWLAPAEPGDANCWIAFDLGDTYNVSAIHLWNYNFFGFGVEYKRGVKDVTVQYKNTQGSWINAQDIEFAIATAQLGYTGETYALAQSFDAQEIRFVVNSNWGYSSGAGIQEVRFVGTEVPEPATMSLLLAGGAAALIRRRKKA